MNEKALLSFFFYIEAQRNKLTDAYELIVKQRIAFTDDFQNDQIGIGSFNIFNIFPACFQNNHTTQESFVKCYVEREVKPFFHCFQYNHLNEDRTIFYYNCLIFNEKEEEGSPRYTPKALIILSKLALFRLFNYKLHELYSDKSSLPSDKITLLLWDLASNSIESTKIYPANPKWQYELVNDSFLPICDLNYHLFFQLFNLNDILFLAEQFFVRNPIILISPRLKILYPLYHSFLQFLYPFNETDDKYTFRLFSESVRHSDKPAFIALYAAEINEELIEKLVKSFKSNTSVIFIKKEDFKYKAVNRYYLYEKSTETIKKKAFQPENIIEQTLKYVGREPIYIQMINDELILFIQEKMKSNSFYASYEKGKFCRLQSSMFGLMSKFLTLLFPNLNYIHAEGQFKLQIESFEMRAKAFSHCTRAFLARLKEFDTCFRSTPSFHILGKGQLELDSSKWKSLIYLDEKLDLFQKKKKKILFCSVKFSEKVAKAKDSIPVDSAHTMIMFEFESYKTLLLNKDIIFTDTKELVYGLTALTLSLIIISDLSNDQASNIAQMNVINEKIFALYTLFYKAEGFKGKFNIFVSLFFFLINSAQHLREDYKDMFIEQFTAFSINPSYSIITFSNKKELNALPKTSTQRKVVIKSQKVSNKQNCNDHLYDCNLITCPLCGTPFQIETKDNEEEIKTDFLIDPSEILIKVVEKLIQENTFIFPNFDEFYGRMNSEMRVLAFFANQFCKIKLFD